MKLPTTLPEVPELIASKRDEIAALCREYGVAKLEVFGSVMTDEFDPDRSDIDFLVEYEPVHELGWWDDRFYELEARFARLVGRPVDIVAMRALDDPFFRHVANMTRMRFYDGPTASQDWIGAEPDRATRREDRVSLRRT